MLRFVFPVLCLMCASYNLRATHIVGGEVTYTCLGNDYYAITLTVYRDCYNGVPDFDAPAFLGIFDANYTFLDSLQLFPAPDDTLPVVLSNPCLSIPPNVCVHRTSYVYDSLYLPPIPGGYTLVYQRCCRNTLIRNIPNPLSTGASYIAVLSDSVLAKCNNSAVFNNWPPVAICVNQPIDFDHSASDPDGDSLVYRLCTPLRGGTFNSPQPIPQNFPPLIELNWEDPPYSLDNLLGGDPMTIDPQTGFITGVPNTIGNFVVGICVDEYREGELLSTTRRDFQYNVADCGEPAAAFFTPEILCDTLTVRFDNNSQSATSFQWFFDYPGTSLTSNSANPVFMYPDTGLYTIMLVARKSAACSDTAFSELYLTETYAEASIDVDFLSCNGDSLFVQAIDMSVDSVYGIIGWNWQLSGPGQPYPVDTLQNPFYKLTLPGTYTLTLTVTAGNGCTRTANFSFFAPIPDTSALNNVLGICPGDSIFLYPDANPVFQYSWSPADNLLTENSPNPLAFPDESTTYTVVMSSVEGCTRSATVTVEVLSKPEIMLSANETEILLGDSVVLSAVTSGAVQYLWTPPGSVVSPNSLLTLAYPEETTTYTFSAGSANCQSTASITISVIVPECDVPFVFFPNAFSPNGDTENDFLKLESNIAAKVYWVIYNRFGEKIFEAHSLNDVWDGTYKGEPQPAETYGYYLEVECVNSTRLLQKKGNVTLLR